MRARDNPLAIKALEIVQDELKAMEEIAIRKVLHAIVNGDLTPELAMQKWHEVYALRMVPMKLRRQGKRAAKRHDSKPLDTL